MNLNRDLKSRGALIAKGWLFLFLGIGASILLLADSFSLQRLILWGIATWSFCRFYYFLFHVLENYAGRQQPYAGVLDAMKWALRRKTRDPME
ncbi:hypothetical protein [Luteolibacter marinus]|uniref:hypothetical protein n=1 Tax=Luteolibacter marinus TaxID=2776705 RepID=UPI001869246D|nr:hypothetical protein [Luteolibacter marinus]